MIALRKKTLSLVTAFILVLGAYMPVSASATDHISSNKGEFVIVDATPSYAKGISVLADSDSWGMGYLRSKDPVGAHPQGYAESVMNNKVKAATLTAKVSCTDDNGDVYSSSKKTSNDVVSTQSATISSKTSGCTFNGDHSFQKTNTSGWQYCTTSWSY